MISCKKNTIEQASLEVTNFAVSDRDKTPLEKLRFHSLQNKSDSLLFSSKIEENYEHHGEMVYSQLKYHAGADWQELIPKELREGVALRMSDAAKQLNGLDFSKSIQVAIDKGALTTKSAKGFHLIHNSIQNLPDKSSFAACYTNIRNAEAKNQGRRRTY
jgi:hypothetical protein